MKIKLTTWLQSRRKQLKSRSKSSKQSADRPPFLPSPRPLAITPKPSHESFATLQQIRVPAQQPSSCPFFAKLPAHVRRYILILAFGERTLHVDLVFDHPVAPLVLPLPENEPRATQRRRETNHAALNSHYRVHDHSPSLREQHDQPKVWGWGGTVCHRNLPWKPDSFRDWMLAWRAPWEDSCQVGDAAYCSLYEGSWPDKCFIGALGFLMSCRQAYVEGIDVLYSTNTLAIASRPLLLHLPKLILPQRLASITSLELLVKAHIETPKAGPWIVDFRHLAPILDVIAAHCWGLRRFYLGLECTTVATRDRVPPEDTLRTVDAFYRSARDRGGGRLREMTLALPRTTSDACRAAAVTPPVQPAPQEKQGSLVWRCLEVEDGGPETQMRRAGNFPGPPPRLTTQEGDGTHLPSAGYWILEGEDDKPIVFMSCFGSTGMA